MAATSLPPCFDFMTKRSMRGIVRSEVGVKDWHASVPDVDEVRPTCCPWCEAPSRVPGEPLGLHGHGLIDRQQWGPIAIGGAARQIVLRVRRYLCTRCSATCCVAPRGVLAGMYYSAMALGLALALWSVEQRPSPVVRSQVSPRTVVGDEAKRGWRSLARWTRAVVAGRVLDIGRLDVSGTPRQQAAAIASALAGHAPPSDRHRDLPSRAWLGALQVA